MAKLSPRGVSLLRSFSSFLCAPPATSPLLHTNKLNIFFSYTTMDKTPQESIKDQLSEGYYKETREYNASDNILPHIFNISAKIDFSYASRATPQDFEIYAPDATFEDPLMCAHGVSQIKSAFYSLGKIFSESRIVEYSLTENEISPGKKEILIDNKQYYKFMGRDINMVSLIKLYTDGGKVVRHEDCWDKKPLRNQNTVTLPLVGRMFELSRRASMLATHAMMGFGRDPPNPVM
nr:NTF2-like domain containing protein [Ipomoea batatas]